MKDIKDTKTALDKFEIAADKHAIATEQSDYKLANKCYDIINKAVLYLKRQNELPKLSIFLSHSSVGVRTWTATYLLPVMEKEAIITLEDIVNAAGPFSFEAKITLNEWRKGNLKV